MKFLVKICLIGGIVLVCSSVGYALRIATYNIENYLSTDRSVEGVYRKDYPKPESEKKAIRSIIKEVAPDILCIQEIGTKEYFDELLEELEVDGIFYPYTVHGGGSDPVRFLAILSKIPFDEVKKHEAIPYIGKGATSSTIKRGLLEVSFKNKETKWHLFNLHLKSRRTSRKDDYQAQAERLSEAVAIRDLIDKEPGQDQPYIILGDFNDDPNSKPLKRFYKKGKRTLAQKLDATDSRGEAWTHHYRYQQSYSTVDHILVSGPMLDFVKNKRATVNDSPFASKGSDHRMVYVDLDL